jgi:hypothetical protein
VSKVFDEVLYRCVQLLKAESSRVISVESIEMIWLPQSKPQLTPRCSARTVA